MKVRIFLIDTIDCYTSFSKGEHNIINNAKSWKLISHGYGAPAKEILYPRRIVKKRKFFLMLVLGMGSLEFLYTHRKREALV